MLRPEKMKPWLIIEIYDTASNSNIECKLKIYDSYLRCVVKCSFIDMTDLSRI